MKNPILTVPLFLLFALSAFGQNSPFFYGLEFLEINAQAQSKAMGDVGVVSPQFNLHSATQQNPALLIRDFRQIDASIKYMPWLRINGTDHYFLEVGGTCNFSKRHAFGLNMKYLSDGLLKIPSTGARSDYVVTMSYAYQFSKRWSAGTTYKIIRNDVITSDGSIGVSTSAVDMGVHYQNVKVLSASPLGKLEGKELKWDFGIALTNLGPKVNLDALYSNMNLHNFLPTTLKLGAMIGTQKKKGKQYAYSWSLAYQMDKRLVPIPNTVDANNDGLYDYLTWGVGQAMWQSLMDASNGWQGEVDELVHKFGLEYRIDDLQYKFALAFRLGYTQSRDALRFKKNVSAGLAVQFDHFYVDITYVSSLLRQQKIYENTVLFSLGSRRHLTEVEEKESQKTLAMF